MILIKLKKNYGIIYIDIQIYIYRYSNRKRISDKEFNINKKFSVRENPVNNKLNILSINIIKNIFEKNSNQNEKIYILQFKNEKI